MFALRERVFPNSCNYNSCDKNKPFLCIFRICLAVVIFTAVLFSILYATDKVLDFRAGTKTLICISALAEVLILFKTYVYDISRVFSSDDVSAIACGGGIIKYFSKIIQVFVSVILSQMLLIVPFFIAYALFRSANIGFFFNCVITIFALGVVIALWALIIYGAMSVIKKHKPNLTKVHEILLFGLLLAVSIVALIVCKSIALDRILLNIVEIFKETIFYLQVFLYTLNNNFIICINIVAIFLVAQGLVKIFRAFKGSEIELVSSINEKCAYVSLKSEKRQENDILRSCLARSPTN